MPIPLLPECPAQVKKDRLEEPSRRVHHTPIPLIYFKPEVPRGLASWSCRAHGSSSAGVSLEAVESGEKMLRRTIKFVL